MGDKTGIEWSDATWNPVTGCSKVSPGCAHCYAETLALTRLTGKAGYPGLPWTPENAAENVVLRPERLDLPLRWRTPRRVFVNSMSDLFHEQVPDWFIDSIFGVMAACQYRGNAAGDAFAWHTFQVLTKRPERMRAYLSTDRRRAWADAAAQYGGRWDPDGLHDFVTYGPTALPNVWLGTSVENQRWADERIPHLLATPAAVRFLSMEPLLGPVDLFRHLWRPISIDEIPGWALNDGCTEGVERRRELHWVIAGGESGPGHRPMDPAWARSIRDQCVAAGVPFLFKQHGGIRPKSGGRELDGRTWDEYPESSR